MEFWKIYLKLVFKKKKKLDLEFRKSENLRMAGLSSPVRLSY